MISSDNKDVNNKILLCILSFTIKNVSAATITMNLPNSYASKLFVWQAHKN